jgi:hypothetical protein
VVVLYLKFQIGPTSVGSFVLTLMSRTAREILEAMDVLAIAPAGFARVGN